MPCSSSSSRTRCTASIPTTPRGSWPSCGPPWSRCGRWPGSRGISRLGTYVRLGRGEEGTGGRDKPSILADTLEAVIGAVYLDRGLEAACRLVHQLFDPVIANSAQLGAGLDWKTSLQELTAAELLGVPEYRVEESGPDHQKLFRATVRVAGRTYGSGQGRSKKEAEQQAAEAAYNGIRNGLESEAVTVRDPKDPAAAAAVPPQDGAGVPPEDATGVPSQNGPAVPPQDGPGVPPEDATGVPPQNGKAVPRQDGKTAPRQDGKAVPPHDGKAGPPEDGAASRRPPRDPHQD